MTQIRDLEDGKEGFGFYYLREKLNKVTRQGKDYFDLVLEDETGTILARVWEIDKQVKGDLTSDTYVKAEYLADTYNEQLQLKILMIREIQDSDYDEGFDESSCHRSSPFPIDKMWEEIRKISSECSSKVSELLFSVLDEYSDSLRAWPAASKMHHAYFGGLLEHTLSVTKTCIYFAKKYRVSRDLIVSGAILHDIGKLEELSRASGGEYTKKGRLVGHIVLGRDIVRKFASKIPDFPEDFLLELEHLILSHQGQPEWGTVKVPMSKEALLLHYADDTDAKFNLVSNYIADDKSEGSFTNYYPNMNRVFLKGTKSAEDQD
ncbi:MAG: HD domain-containing protein [Nitrospinota bacterium]|nr:HD domain-containing protein [Nitrospinota bacterium]